MDLPAPADVIDGGVAIAPLTFEWMYRPLPPLEGARISPNYQYLSMEDRRALPLVPIWSGLIGSSLLFAAAWAPIIFLLSAPAVLLRIVRRRKGRCVRCGYPRRVDRAEACSECGLPIGQRLPLITGGRMAIARGMVVLMLVATMALAAALFCRFDHPHPIFHAARHDDADRLARLVADGVSPNQRHRSDWDEHFEMYDSTPLMWAAAHGSVRAMQVLIEAGARVNAADADGAVALLHAAKNGHRDSARMLIAGGAEIERVDWFGTTALMHAAWRGHAEVVKILIESGADIEHTDLDGSTALMCAARSANPEVVTLLLDAGADPMATRGQRRTTALCDAASFGRVENARRLIEAGAEVNPASGQSPLSCAVEERQSEVALFLLESGAELNGDGESVLRKAAEHNLTEVVRELLRARVDPNPLHPTARGRTPLRSAVGHSNLEMARLLIEAGADPLAFEALGGTLLFDVNWREASPQLIDFVLNLGIDVNDRAARGFTALMLAARYGNPDAVRMLLQAGADPLLVNDDGRTALDLAEQAPEGAGKTGAPEEEIIRLLRRAAAPR